MRTKPLTTPKSASTEAELVERIMDEFHSSIRELRCTGMERLVKAGLSMTNLHVLGLLSRHGELPMSRLAEILDVSVSNATGLIDRMEERGLVERLRVADDRRIVKVRLSAAGTRTLEEAEILKKDLVAKILGQMTVAQHERLARCLGDVREAVAKVVAAEGPEAFGHTHAHDIQPHEVEGLHGRHVHLQRSPETRSSRTRTLETLGSEA
jgi:DNA-binding MarR family transcriptional regulator